MSRVYRITQRTKEKNMSRVYRITQQVEHVIDVRANSEADACMFADELGDDDFADQSWGSTDVKVLPKKVTSADEDITDLEGEDSE